jgi:hypothetical protein
LFAINVAEWFPGTSGRCSSRDLPKLLRAPRVHPTLCDYNDETTPANNLECKAVEKKHVTEY